MKLLSLNLNGQGVKHGLWSERRELVVDLLTAEEPDLVALQAVAAGSRAGANQASELAERVPALAHVYCEPADDSEAALGVALLSRTPLCETSALRFAARPGSEDPSPRVFLRAHLNTAQGRLCVCSVHVSWVSAQAAPQLRELVRWLVPAEENLLLAGDLNTPADSELLEVLRTAQLHDVWSALRPHEAGPTFESDAPAIRIDYVWASALLLQRAVHVKRCTREREGVRLSDHCALLAHFWRE